MDGYGSLMMMAVCVVQRCLLWLLSWRCVHGFGLSKGEGRPEYPNTHMPEYTTMRSKAPEHSRQLSRTEPESVAKCFALWVYHEKTRNAAKDDCMALLVVILLFFF